MSANRQVNWMGSKGAASYSVLLAGAPRLLLTLLLAGVALHAGPAATLGRPADDSRQNRPKAARGGGSTTKIDVCALLTSAEIEAVQGEPIREVKPSEQHGSSFLLSQCFLGTATFAKSVSLALATPDPAKPSALTPREYWRKQFHPPEPEEEEKPAAAGKAPKKAEPEREKELRQPRPVEGLGEEAYWVGNAITGALYVLQGDAFLRIGIGGGEDELERIKKTKTLAQKALGRLPANPEQRK